MDTRKHWSGKSIDPEKLHGKEEWERIKKQNLENYYKATVGEIDYIMETAFDIPDLYKKEMNRAGEIKRIPNFIISHPDFREFYTNPELVQQHGKKFQNITNQELRVNKGDLADDIEVIYNGCKKVYEAVKQVLTEFIQADYQRIKNSDDDLLERVKKLEVITENAVDLIEFFGVRSQNRNRSTFTGLVYGSDILHLLIDLEQSGHGAVRTTLEGNFIPQNNYFKSDQTNVSLEHLEEFQRIAVLKAKDFIAVQELLISTDQTGIQKYGRPETYPKDQTLEWYEELKVKPEYQHRNRVPFKKLIKEEIISRHTHQDSETGQTMEPGIDIINKQFKALGLTKS